MKYCDQNNSREERETAHVKRHPGPVCLHGVDGQVQGLVKYCDQNSSREERLPAFSYL